MGLVASWVVGAALLLVDPRTDGGPGQLFSSGGEMLFPLTLQQQQHPRGQDPADTCFETWPAGGFGDHNSKGTCLSSAPITGSHPWSVPSSAVTDITQLSTRTRSCSQGLWSVEQKQEPGSPWSSEPWVMKGARKGTMRQPWVGAAPEAGHPGRACLCFLKGFLTRRGLPGLCQMGNARGRAVSAECGHLCTRRC